MTLPKMLGLLVATGALVGAPAAGATERPPELQWQACGGATQCVAFASATAPAPHRTPALDWRRPAAWPAP